MSNLTVRGLHTFAVGQAQVLVHNTSGSDPASLPFGGEEGAKWILQSLRTARDFARSIGETELVNKIAYQLERTEALIAKHYPNIIK
ncbi:MAG: hypothetical protein ACJ8FY_28485 [Gemmataceae bacterium]